MKKNRLDELAEETGELYEEMTYRGEKGQSLLLTPEQCRQLSELLDLSIKPEYCFTSLTFWELFESWMPFDERDITGPIADALRENLGDRRSWEPLFRAAAKDFWEAAAQCNPEDDDTDRAVSAFWSYMGETTDRLCNDFGSIEASL